MKPLKLAIVAGTFPTLSETFILQQIERLLALGHDVRIFAFDAGKEPTAHPAVKSLGLSSRTTYLKSPRHLTTRLRAFAQRMRGREPETFDAIICHFGHIGERVRQMRALGLMSGPLAVVFHAYDLTVWLRANGANAYDSLFAEADLLLPISEHWAAKLSELGAPADRVRVLHVGVDCAQLEYRPRNRSSDQPLRLLSVGRLVEKKGFRHALEALALARPRLPQDFEYVIAGHGPLLAELQTLATERGLEEHVHFAGPLTNLEVQARMAQAHALLVPSVTASNGDKEGIPVVLMEAMAQGLPVLTTRHSGIPELARDGETGWCVPEGDAPALAQALLAFASDQDAWRTITDRARQLIEADFNAVVQAQRLVEAVGALAGKS